MPEVGGVQFRRVRFSVGDRVVWLDWNDRPDGKSPLPFTLWTYADRGEGAPIDCRVVMEPDSVGWRRAPDPEPGPDEDSKGAAAEAPGPKDQG